MTPTLEGLDHIHIYVVNRLESEEWYARVLGLRRSSEFESWVSDRGPLTIGNSSGTVHLALFERPAEKCHSVIAFRAIATEFIAWQSHLSAALGHSVDVVNHDLSWSLYFTDPDGNPFEITSYDYKQIASALAKTGF
ncbi:MAG TPA: VOC family protein [Methylophilaceae bacterium]|jgi:catechol-2,3-dioxygenase